MSKVGPKATPNFAHSFMEMREIPVVCYQNLTEKNYKFLSAGKFVYTRS